MGGRAITARVGGGFFWTAIRVQEGRFSDHLNRTVEKQAGRAGNFRLVLFRLFFWKSSSLFPFFSLPFPPPLILLTALFLDRYRDQAGWAGREGRIEDHLDCTGETQAGRAGNFRLVLFLFFPFFGIFPPFSPFFPTFFPKKYY